MCRLSAILFVAIVHPVTASADDISVTYETRAAFDDITFEVENAIIDAGLVIEGRSHIGEMLARTKDDVGGSTDIYTNAEIFTFCSASVSRIVMEADPLNIRHCPYSIFLFETPDKPGIVTVGHANLTGSMAPAGEMLSNIVSDALNLD